MHGIMRLSLQVDSARMQQTGGAERQKRNRCAKSVIHPLNDCRLEIAEGLGVFAASFDFCFMQTLFSTDIVMEAVQMLYVKLISPNGTNVIMAA
jgi:hypothetical protein